MYSGNLSVCGHWIHIQKMKLHGNNEFLDLDSLYYSSCLTQVQLTFKQELYTAYQLSLPLVTILLTGARHFRQWQHAINLSLSGWRVQFSLTNSAYLLLANCSEVVHINSK